MFFGRKRFIANKTGATKTIKKKKAPATKTAFRNVIQALDMPLKPSWYFRQSDEYIVFSPFGKQSPCHTIRIDVGTKHLGISGISATENRKYPICTWFSLISVPAKSLH